MTRPTPRRPARAARAPLLAALLMLGAGKLLGQSAAGAAPDPSASADQLFAEANRRFNAPNASEADLERAASLYRELIDRGHRNAALYYNLANTYLRLGDRGRAVLNFRRALLYDPDHAYSLAMLREARSRVPDRFLGRDEDSILGTLFFWHFRTTAPERVAALAAFAGAFWTLLALRLFRRVPYHRTLIAGALVAAVALGASLAVEALDARGEDAVVVARQVDVRSGNGPQFPTVYEQPVEGGVELRVIETRGAWRQVEFPDGAVGWVEAHAVETIVERSS
jgi:tetratricopeptide (TPR) repeat protein